MVDVDYFAMGIDVKGELTRSVASDSGHCLLADIVNLQCMGCSGRPGRRQNSSRTAKQIKNPRRERDRTSQGDFLALTIIRTETNGDAQWTSEDFSRVQSLRLQR